MTFALSEVHKGEIKTQFLKLQLWANLEFYALSTENEWSITQKWEGFF